MLILRILIFFGILIFLPLETISSQINISFEKAYLVLKLNKFISNNNFFSNFVYNDLSILIAFVLSDRDSIILYNSCLYLISHPFKIIKVIMVTNMGYYLIVLLRLLYKENRPYWDFNSNNNVLCNYSYASPSLHSFISTFYWTYLIIQFFLGNKENITQKKKFLSILLIIFINLLTNMNLFINQQNYLYQPNYGNVISLVLVCIFLDLESKIHNFLFNTMKNVYKVRKYKIQSFLLILFIVIFTTIIFNFMENESLNVFITNILKMVIS